MSLGGNDTYKNILVKIFKAKKRKKTNANKKTILKYVNW